MVRVKTLAARLYGTRDIRIGEEDPPAVAEDGTTGERDELVRVTAVGICGSDLHWWTEGAIGDATLARPLVLGHEGAGVIESGPRAGERVAIDPAITCGTCRACRAGYRNLCYRIQFAGHGATDGMMRAGSDDVAPILVHVQAIRMMAPRSAALPPEAVDKVLAELTRVLTHFNFSPISDGVEKDNFGDADGVVLI